MAKREPKKTPTGVVLAVLALVAAGAWFLGDRWAGFGESSEQGTAPQMPDLPEGEEVHIVVQGERCLPTVGQLEGCDASCQRLLGGAGETRVVIDASAGQHGVVEALRECLEAGDIRSIRAVGAPPESER